MPRSTASEPAATTPPLSGRRAEAARNDGVILGAAREVFLADPGAPIAAVAERAGVGIGALYRRYPSKDALLQRLCGDGLQSYIEAAEASLADDLDPWAAFAGFLSRVVDIGAGSLTVRLAGTFSPTPELFAAARRGGELNVEIVRRAHEAGVLRPDFTVNDVGILFEALASIGFGARDRDRKLRQRYLSLWLDGMRTPPAQEPLPASPPTDRELQGRWQRR
ncbi:MAG TPA: helix-turn-helix domain-containing protein [Propionibacteriaceae bacterium]|jgi:AcrR family transcriptional regulator|nr:helix-turn-helix domain-containing protein [Propionibacteriaceae bacterium]